MSFKSLLRVCMLVSQQQAIINESKELREDYCSSSGHPTPQCFELTFDKFHGGAFLELEQLVKDVEGIVFYSEDGGCSAYAPHQCCCAGDGEIHCWDSSVDWSGGYTFKSVDSYGKISDARELKAWQGFIKAKAKARKRLGLDREAVK